MTDESRLRIPLLQAAMTALDERRGARKRYQAKPDKQRGVMRRRTGLQTE
jgi:hypothetical protein